LVVEW